MPHTCNYDSRGAETSEIDFLNMLPSLNHMPDFQCENDHRGYCKLDIFSGTGQNV